VRAGVFRRRLFAAPRDSDVTKPYIQDVIKLAQVEAAKLRAQ
jgi:hypothetical protein